MEVCVVNSASDSSNILSTSKTRIGRIEDGYKRWRESGASGGFTPDGGLFISFFKSHGMAVATKDTVI